MGSFDLFSLVVGVIIGLVAAVVLRVRERVMALRRAVGRRVAATKRFATRSADARYRIDLTRDCQTMHIAGDLMNLTEIIVEPRFLPAPEPSDPEGAGARSVMHVVPQHHDMPFGYAPFNLETVALQDLATGGPRLAILGIPGAGKTTALATIALHALGELDFRTMAGLAEEQEARLKAEQEEKEREELTDEERTAAEKVRQQQEEIERRAIEHLRSLQLAEDTDETVFAGLERFDWSAYTPMLIHLADVELDPETFGEEVDPAEPLMLAIQRRVGAVAQRTIPRFVYKQVAAGNALMLVDGYDELPPDMREAKLAWLRHFLDTYPDNLVYLAGPAEGYGPLMELGFAPVFLRPWTDQDGVTLAEKWAAAWPAAVGAKRKPAPAPEEHAVKRASIHNRSRTPLDITLKVWMSYAEDGREVGRLGWYDAYVHRYFEMEEEEHAERGRRFIETMAARILDTNGYSVDKEELRTVLTKLFTVTETVTEKTKEGEEGEVKEEVLINVDRFVRNLSGRFRLMVERPDGTLNFRHPLLCSYLAAETIAKEPARDPADLVTRPAWYDSLPFLAARANVDRAVVASLSTQPDLLYTNLFRVASWLIDAPSAARWRGEVFKRLTRALMAPSQFRVVRERVLGAIIAARDENTLFIFRQGLRANNPHVRQLACLGLGALGTPEAIQDLMPMLADDVQDVQLSAGLALGAIGSERALEVMVQGLVEGEENLRRAVAEALAALPGDGHDIVRDAASHEDMMVRRAAVFGLRRIKAMWAVVQLYRVMLEDEQWYVRSAAQEAFGEARNPQVEALRETPPVESLSWLVSWAAEQGGAVPAGDAAKQVLVRALQEGESAIRKAAADTLGIVGYLPAIKPLYLALRDKDETVRDEVFRALGNLQAHLGQPLPVVA